MSSVQQSDSQTRTRILEATRRLMEERRGLSVRMKDVADVAGVSRQAVYDHFGSRANLILATTHYVDRLRRLDERKRPFDAARTGLARLETYIEFWGAYIPEIYGLAQALMADRNTDPAAAAAWDDRMAAVRGSCAIIVESLRKDQTLREGWADEEATDFLWTLLSIRNWESLTIDCGWTQEQYVRRIHETAKRALTTADRSSR
jgi:AcrR family transcriptional regulator